MNTDASEQMVAQSESDSPLKLANGTAAGVHDYLVDMTRASCLLLSGGSLAT